MSIPRTSSTGPPASPDPTPRASCAIFPAADPAIGSLAAFYFVERDDDGGLLYEHLQYGELLRLPADVRRTLEVIASLEADRYLREPLGNEADDEIASLLAHLARSDASQRRDLLRALRAPHAQALRVFAQRMATLTVQTASQPVLVRGLTAALAAALNHRQNRNAALGVVAILADAAGRAGLDFHAALEQGDRLTCGEAHLPADVSSRFGEIVAALDELDELLRSCNMPEHAAWVRRARDDRDFEAVRRALAGMGSISDVSLLPPQGSGLTPERAHAKRDELIRRLDRLTDPSLEAPRPRPMIPVGTSSSEVDTEWKAPSSWEPIYGFTTPGEFARFDQWIADRISDGQAEAVEVEAHLRGVTSQAERWYRHVDTLEIWRLVEPDPPSRGVFLRVDPARPDR